MKYIIPLGLTEEEIRLLKNNVEHFIQRHHKIDDAAIKTYEFIHRLEDIDDSLFKNVIVVPGREHLIVQRIKV